MKLVNFTSFFLKLLAGLGQVPPEHSGSWSNLYPRSVFENISVFSAVSAVKVAKSS